MPNKHRYLTCHNCGKNIRSDHMSRHMRRHEISTFVASVGNGETLYLSKDKYSDVSDTEINPINMITARGNTSPNGLKKRLYHLKDIMKVFELDIPSEHGLTNFDLVLYIEQLKVPYFRGVFMRDELPKNSNPIECGIMNLNKSEQIGSHWVCFVRNKKDRIYFDSFGQITPLELQKYLKTKQEFKNNTSIIKRNTDIVQRVNTHVCGHLCLVVLTSLMREQLNFQEVLDRLNYGYSQNYW